VIVIGSVIVIGPVIVAVSVNVNDTVGVIGSLGDRSGIRCRCGAVVELSRRFGSLP
jgi:hypothetical protein